MAGHGGVLELGPEEEFVSNAMSAMNAMREVVRVASCVFRDLIVSVLGLYGSGGVRLVTSAATSLRASLPYPRSESHPVGPPSHLSRANEAAYRWVN